MKKNLKKFILAGTAALAAVACLATGRNVVAATTLDFNADSNVSTSYKSGTVVLENEYATFKTVKNATVTKNASIATAENDSSLKFEYALLPSGSTTDSTIAALEVTSKVAGVKVGVYFTVTNGDFASKVQSKAGTFKVIDSSNTALYTGDESSCANETAYYDEYTINNADDTVYFIATSNRLAVMGLVVSQGVVSVEYDVTIMDGTSVLTTQSVVSGQNLMYTPVKYGYDFAGYYSNADFTEPFDVANTPVTESMTLYAKFTEWTLVIDKYTLSSELVEKLEANYQGFSSDLPLDGTIYTIMNGSQMQTSSNVPCIGTSGGLSTTKNGIKFTVEVAGTITVEMTSAGGSARSAKLINENGEAVTTTSNLDWTLEEATAYEKRTLTWALEAGTYYLGGTNGMRVFNATFTAEDKLVGAQVSTDGTAVRFVGLLNGTDFNKVVFSVTCNDVNVTKEMPTVYENVTAAENGVQTIVSASDLGCDYLAAWTITGLDKATEYVFTVSVSVDDVAGDTFTVTVNNGTVTVVRVAE